MYNVALKFRISLEFDTIRVRIEELAGRRVQLGDMFFGPFDLDVATGLPWPQTESW